MLHCSTCLIDINFILRLTLITYSSHYSNVIPFNTTYSHSNSHYHHQHCITHTARLLLIKMLYSTFQYSQSQDTEYLGSSSAYYYISLKYPTQSLPNCTQPQSLSVDALSAYCYLLRLCLISKVIIACCLPWLSPPRRVEGGG